jgi:hypothetical protein
MGVNLARLSATQQVAAILTADRQAIIDAYTQALQTGRPRKADRCPCGEMTRKRAEARGHRCTAIATPARRGSDQSK